MIKKLGLLLCLFAMPFAPATAQEGGRQIRLDGNTCKNIMPEYMRKRNNPLYAKAIAARKIGHANDMQMQRIREVGFLYDTLKAAKCKVSK